MWRRRRGHCCSLNTPSYIKKHIALPVIKGTFSLNGASLESVSKNIRGLHVSGTLHSMRHSTVWTVAPITNCMILFLKKLGCSFVIIGWVHGVLGQSILFVLRRLLQPSCHPPSAPIISNSVSVTGMSRGVRRQLWCSMKRSTSKFCAAGLAKEGDYCNWGL